jgi:uncharacterized protein
VTDPDRELRQPTTATWSSLLPGTELTIVKLAPDGSEAARYRGEVVSHREDSWILVQATWTNRTVELGELSFCPGDVLLEWFSPRHPFNAFAVFSAKKRFKGWYANVTHPARLDVAADPPVLIWHDLFLDLVGLADGSFTVRDEDELLASGLSHAEPELYERILGAQSELIRRFELQLPPFVNLATLTALRDRSGQNLLSQ